MPETDLQALLKQYGEINGYKAYEYACLTYNKWKYGYVKMSDQTLLRLVETLPYFITDQEKFNLLEKIFYDYLKIYNYINQKKLDVRINWDNYYIELQKLQEKLTTEEFNQVNIIELPNEVKELAKWLYDDDMKVANNILNNLHSAQCKNNVKSACIDIQRFVEVCKQLEIKELVYDIQTLRIDLSMIVINIVLIPRNKGLVKTLIDIFF